MKRKRYLKRVCLIISVYLLFSAFVIPYGKISAYELRTKINNMSEESLSESVLRIHIIANSNTEADQTVKLKIRDELIKKYSEKFSFAGTKEEAKNMIETQKGEIAEFVNGLLTQNGFDYTCRIQIVEDIFPNKTYGDLFFPAGEYTALKVILGKGEGKNWWCVLYPPLCFLNADSDEESKKYAQEHDGQIQVRFRLSELIKSFKSSQNANSAK